ncbi:hypothetical protein AJ80_06261 [Polytolypa hystricis UAMH7299]|uniref:Fucose-specific lectin n=1 Tax=Polytolypa hystricis (strain UAMH7299) TaxID=1447883 RepID=A0A2B7XXH0_POLH7|nr:hypothetical protein AJ80_06261 [Polytolypa hystricis UAMH7299]
MAALSTTVVLFLTLFLHFIPLARSAKKPIVPSNNQIVVKRRDPGAKTVGINGAIRPRENSPLASHYTKSRKFPGADSLVVWYLDEDNQIIKCSCRYQDGEYLDYFTNGTGFRSASGLAAVQVGLYDARRFYIDEDDYVIEQTQSDATRLGPKTVRGSSVSAAVPINSTDIHLFFVAEDMSLSSLTWNGTRWSKARPVIENFASDPAMTFAAAAWPDPLIIRAFYIDEHGSASEWTIREGGSRANAINTVLEKVDALNAGQPVAVWRSAADTGRYVEYFYAASKGRINYVARRNPDEGPFQVPAVEYEVAPPPKGPDTTAIVSAVAGVLGVIVAVLVALLKKEQVKRWWRACTTGSRSNPQRQQLLR